MARACADRNCIVVRRGLVYFQVLQRETKRMKNFLNWVSCLGGPLCLLVLLIVWVLWSGAHQPSFGAFVARELIVLLSWLLAIIFSVWGFGNRPRKLKFLNITIVVFASVLAPLDAFSLL